MNEITKHDIVAYRRFKSERLTYLIDKYSRISFPNSEQLVNLKKKETIYLNTSGKDESLIIGVAMTENTSELPRPEFMVDGANALTLTESDLKEINNREDKFFHFNMIIPADATYQLCGNMDYVFFYRINNNQ